MNHLRACANCGTSAPHSEAHFCARCGARLSDPAPAVEEPTEDISTRLRALEAHPDLAALLASEPRSHSPALAARGFAFFSLFILGSLFLALLSAAFFPPLVLLPVAAIAIALYAIASTLLRQLRTRRAAIHRRPAIVTDLSTRIRGGGGAEGRVRHTALLSFGDGTRAEYLVDEEVLDLVSVDAAGVAFVQAGQLIDFARLPG